MISAATAAGVALTLLGPGGNAVRQTLDERAVTQRLCADLDGRPEVRLEDGRRVDCLTATHAIEVEWSPKWAEAIGQALGYAVATGRRPGIYLLLRTGAAPDHVRRLREVQEAYWLPLDVWVVER